MLHLFPQLVHLDRVPDHPSAMSGTYDVHPPHQHWVPSSGALSSAKSATADNGKMLFNHHTSAIAAILRNEFALTGTQ